MVSALQQLPPDAPLLPEDEYVPGVEDCACLDVDLVRLGDKLWADVGRRGAEMVADLRQVTCPTMIVKSKMFPRRDAPPEMREEQSGQPNVRTARFTNTGHLIHREQFDHFIAPVRDFFSEAGSVATAGPSHPDWA